MSKTLDHPSEWAVVYNLEENSEATCPTEQQVGGDHYKKLAIQPVAYIVANKLGFWEGNVIKYVTRWGDKGGLADLKKAKHMIDLLIHNEGLI